MKIATRNQLANLNNQYQGNSKRVLTVCSAGLLRSPTAAIVLQREYGYNTRASGLDEDFALIPFSHALFMWADEVVAMEDKHKENIKWLLWKQVENGKLYEDDVHNMLNDTPIINLNIPDAYNYMDKDLQAAILSNYKAFWLEWINM